MSRRRSRWWLRAPALVAPDKFKGTMPAAEVAAAIASGLRDGGREAEELPVADGGEGTAVALVRALGGEWIETEASDPLGTPVPCRFALLDRAPAALPRRVNPDARVAVVEAAEASGLWRLQQGARPLVAWPLAAVDAGSAWNASTRGTGELIAAAVDAGATTVIVAVGGTASTDGGWGALEGLTDAGIMLPSIVAVCDVRTPWEQAASVFAPQKGADSDTVRRLAQRLTRQAKSLDRDPRGVPMGGAGGGLAGGLWAGAAAELVPGAPFVLDALGFDARMRRSAFVVTGEGRIDDQTLQGKAAGEVAVRCRQAGVACHAIVGQDGLDDFDVRVLALDSLTEAGDPATLADAARQLA